MAAIRDSEAWYASSAMNSPARDTTKDAHDAQLRAYRDMAPGRTVELALELSEAVREVARQGIRQRHPEYSPDDVGRALIVLLYGADAARHVWPDVEPPAP